MRIMIFAVMPNGNVLVIAWEARTNGECWQQAEENQN